MKKFMLGGLLALGVMFAGNSAQAYNVYGNGALFWCWVNAIPEDQCGNALEQMCGPILAEAEAYANYGGSCDQAFYLGEGGGADPQQCERLGQLAQQMYQVYYACMGQF